MYTSVEGPVALFSLTYSESSTGLSSSSDTRRDALASSG